MPTKAKRHFIRAFKKSCYLCGDTENLTFHHRDKTTKSFELGDREALNKSRAEIRDEIEKCMVLCVDCHEGVEATGVIL